MNEVQNHLLRQVQDVENVRQSNSEIYLLNQRSLAFAASSKDALCLHLKKVWLLKVFSELSLKGYDSTKTKFSWTSLWNFMNRTHWTTRLQNGINSSETTRLFSIPERQTTRAQTNEQHIWPKWDGTEHVIPTSVGRLRQRQVTFDIDAPLSPNFRPGTHMACIQIIFTVYSSNSFKI